MRQVAGSGGLNVSRYISLHLLDNKNDDFIYDDIQLKNSISQRGAAKDANGGTSVGASN
jgi:hypothetical protein